MSALERLRSAPGKGYQLVGIKDISCGLGIDHFEMCKMMQEIGRIDRDSLMERFKEQKLSPESLREWANCHLIFSGNADQAPVRQLLLEQVADAFFWRKHVNPP